MFSSSFIAIIYTCIWIAYILKSVRVKNTFVNGRRVKVRAIPLLANLF
ncbi:DUF2569 family protein [Gilliamella sp. Pra-s65]|nr:DUF2569 family protein [Gilliamella sp. Pra-s60]MWN90297.1 DUF2569 family protein [Gilliamella sp. Pra-s65]MWP30259.1 DUF2569 family protein [Gilliamella sp. Pra-s54]MWP46433.1 DUF2569 family protein [Gilliamella sp. Pas-s27]MWP73246.1 DUF2569 family protein [Gilliamella sp. Pra-s52]